MDVNIGAFLKSIPADIYNSTGQQLINGLSVLALLILYQAVIHHICSVCGTITSCY